MRKSLFASLLVLALCVSVVAGDISNPPIAPPQPPLPAETTQGTTDASTTDAGTSSPAYEAATEGDGADSLSAAALIAINSVLALF